MGIYTGARSVSSSPMKWECVPFLLAMLGLFGCQSGSMPENKNKTSLQINTLPVGASPSPRALNVVLPSPTPVPVPSNADMQKVPAGVMIVSNTLYQAYLTSRRMGVRTPATLFPSSGDASGKGSGGSNSGSDGSEMSIASLSAAAQMGSDLLNISEHQNHQDERERDTSVDLVAQARQILTNNGDRRAHTSGGDFILESAQATVHAVSRSAVASEDPDNIRRIRRAHHKLLQRQNGSRANGHALVMKTFDTNQHGLADSREDLHRVTRELMDFQIGANIPGTEVKQPPINCGYDLGATQFKGDATGEVGISDRFSQNGLVANFNFQQSSFLTCVKNQASRGTCSAFGTTSAVETQVAATAGRLVNLSEQALYFQGKGVLDNTYFDEDGFYAEDYLAFSKNFGYRIPLERVWDYNTKVFDAKKASNPCSTYPESCSNTPSQGFPVCAFQTGNSLVCGLIGQVFNLGIGAQVTDYADLWDSTQPRQSLSAMISVLQTSQPMPLILQTLVTDDFQNVGTSGFLTQTVPPVTHSGSHIVHVVGFISNDAIMSNAITSATATDYAKKNRGLISGTEVTSSYSYPRGYFIVKNSWSPLWGDKGYAYLPDSYVLNNTLAVQEVSEVDFKQ